MQHYAVYLLFYMFRVSITPIIRSTQNCNYSLRYCAATFLQRGQASLATLEGGSCTKNMTSTGGCSYNVVDTQNIWSELAE